MARRKAPAYPGPHQQAPNRSGVYLSRAECPNQSPGRGGRLSTASSLDAETESKILKAISFLTQGKTTIVIAHRLSTILNSDKIFVINQGLVVDEGSHNDLLNTSDIYKNFYEKQIKKK